MDFGCAVVERTEPPIGRRHAIGMIHFEMAVVKVVDEVGHVLAGAVAKHQAIETGVPWAGAAPRRDARLIMWTGCEGRKKNRRIVE
jgi:hypothetical protein